ncbi:MAG: hypothetical protein WKF37_19355 [Bryobacteraceae bacterium]
MKNKMIIGAAWLFAGQIFGSTITVTTGNLNQTRAAETAFLAGKSNIITETFEGFKLGRGKGHGYYGDRDGGWASGRISRSGGACLHCDKLAVLVRATTFSGCFNTTAGGKTGWIRMTLQR